MYNIICIIWTIYYSNYYQKLLKKTNLEIPHDKTTKGERNQVWEEDYNRALVFYADWLITFKNNKYNYKSYSK